MTAVGRECEIQHLPPYPHYIILIIKRLYIFYIDYHVYNLICIVKWRAACVCWMLGGRYPRVGMSAAYLVAEDRHPIHSIWWTLYVKAKTLSSHLTHICLSLSDI